MLKNELKQFSICSILYDRIPENHILKRINNVVDFSFINDLLENSYCKYYGRPAKEPEMMIRLLILQYLYNLSDVQVIQDTRVNLAYMWFIGINPEDELPDPSLLAKFRTHRLKETSLDDVITEVVKQCVEKGIIKGTEISVDATHTHANTIKKVPERVMKHLSKKILKNLQEENRSIPENIDVNIPNYKEIEDHKQAKECMENYLEKLIFEVKSEVDISTLTKTKNAIQKAEEILKDPKFIQQKGVRSLVDEDARVGYKSKTDNFFGYKVEFAMVSDERIITAVTVQDGAYVDGTQFNDLIELTENSGVNIKEVYGDKAYFKKPILDKIKEIEAEAYIPVSEMAYKIDEEMFSYNKDSDEWFCNQGNSTILKKHRKDKSGKQTYKYYFEKERCRNCPQRNLCLKGNQKTRVLEIGINTPEFYEYSQRQKTDEFKEKYKKRACQEWKNGEMKRFHGMDRARGYGLKSMRTQAKLTALAVNLKRIARLLPSKSNDICQFIVKILNVSLYRHNYHLDVA